jgi:RNA polymerase sigma factor (sigma-70 family)
MEKRWDARLYEDLYAQIKSWFIARLVREQDAEDLTQQVFAELTRGNASDNSKAYIHGIARNLLSQHWRKKAKERAVLRGLLAERMGSAGAAKAPNSTAAQEQDPGAQHIGGFENLLDGLAAEHAELLRMRFQDGLSMDQMARKLRCSEDAVRKRLQRTIKRLREESRRNGDSPVR